VGCVFHERTFSKAGMMSKRQLKQRDALPEILPPLPITGDHGEPPDDHEGFLEARAPGLRAVRRQIEKRRKRK
jgi:hypothetical protein